MKVSSCLPVDKNFKPIQAGSALTVATVALNASTYVAVTLPSGVSCKSVSAKTRSGSTWRLAASAIPAAYVTIPGMLTLNIVANAGDTVFYALGAAADTLELILLD